MMVAESFLILSYARAASNTNVSEGDNTFQLIVGYLGLFSTILCGISIYAAKFSLMIQREAYFRLKKNKDNIMRPDDNSNHHLPGFWSLCSEWVVNAARCHCCSSNSRRLPDITGACLTLMLGNVAALTLPAVFVAAWALLLSFAGGWWF